MAGFVIGTAVLAWTDPATYGNYIPFLRPISLTLRLAMGALIIRALHPFGKPVASLTFAILMIEPILSVVSGFGVAFLLSTAFRKAGFSTSLIGVSRAALKELQSLKDGSD